MTIYSLCDRTHVALVPWHRAGYACVALDTQKAADPLDGIKHLQIDIFRLRQLRDATFVLAFPPCTHLAASGARWFDWKGPRVLQGALRMVEYCEFLIGRTPALLENPVGRLSAHWMRPTGYVDPWEFDGLTTEDDAYTKRTGLWAFNGAQMPRKQPSGMPVDKTRIWLAAETKQRANLRSMTPSGLANAIFLANRSLVCP